MNAGPRHRLEPTRGVANPGERIDMGERTCTIDGCLKRHKARGLCEMHYARWRAHGDPQHERPSLAARLMAGLTRVESGCLEWRGSLGSYGQLTDKGSVVATHRLAWSLAHPGEPLPPVIRHSCDNPPCCEPTHLLAGTSADNMRDALERDRVPRGERHHRAKLSDQQVAAIRADYAAGGITQTELGRRYGVKQACVSELVRRTRR